MAWRAEPVEKFRQRITHDVLGSFVGVGIVIAFLRRVRDRARHIQGSVGSLYAVVCLPTLQRFTGDGIGRMRSLQPRRHPTRPTESRKSRPEYSPIDRPL